MRAKPMLLGKVALIYFGLLVLVGLLISWASTRLVEESIIATTGLEAQRTASLLLHHLTPDDFAPPLAGPRYAEFHQFIQGSLSLEGVARLVLWNKDGMIIYSDEPRLIGQSFPLEESLARALWGETVARIGRPHGTEGLAGGRAGERFVEVYAPLRFPGASETIGAYELYLNYAPYAQEAAQIQRTVLGFLAAGGAALFGVAMLLFMGPARTIWRQRKEMEEALTEKTWLVEQAAKAMDEVLALEEIAGAMAGELKLERLLPLVTEKAASLTGAEQAGIVLLDAERRQLRCPAAYGAQAEQLRTRDLPADIGLGAWVARTGQPISVPDMWADERTSELARSLFGHRPVAVVPLASGSNSLGSLFTFGQERGPAFTDHQLRLLAALADHAAAAIERGRLYEAAERRAQRLHALHDLSLGITAASEPAEVMRSVTEKARILLGADRAILRRLEESSGKLVCAFIAGPLPAGTGLEDLTAEVGKGVAGMAGQQRRTMLVRHYQTSPYAIDRGRRMGTGSMMGAPLLVGERLMGTLSVSSPQAEEWGPEDAELLTLFANQAAIALEKARLYQEAERRAQEATFLAEAGRLFNSTLQLDELLQQVAAKCTAVLGELAAIHFVEEGSPILKTAAVHSVNPQWAALRLEVLRQRPFQKGEGVVGLVAATGQPVLAADYPRHPAVRPDMVEKLGTKSYLAVPIVASGKVLGVLASAIYEGERRFGKGDLRLAQAIADQAAVALEKARLYQEAERRAQEAAFLAEAGRLFNSTLQLDELLQQVVVKCTAVLGEGAVIYLIEEGSPFLKTAAVHFLDPQRAERRQELARQRPFRQDEGVMGLAAAGQPVLAADYPCHPAALRDMVERLGTKSYLAVPIIASGKVLGVLASAICEGERRFGEADLRLAQAIADQAAVALEKARLFDLVVQGKKEWETAFDAIADGIAVQDRDFTVRRANQAMAEFFGTTVQEMVRRKCYDISYGRDGPCPDCPLAPEKLTGRGTKLTPRELVRGERHLLTTHHPLWDDAGQFLGSAVYARDITQERMLQETIVRTESLRALGEMAGGVAHNFNNLLAAILGRAELALQSASGGLEPSVRRSLEIIQQAALDGGQMTRRIQALIRRPSDQETAPVRINEVVQEVVEATRPRWKDQAERAGITIAVDTQLGQVPAVLGQANELREVLTGIVFNAVDAMPQGGRLLLGTWAEGDSVFIAVQDNGIGMTAEVRQRVFDPFFTTKGERGSGLGLSVAYSIVAQHGGDISVESRLGQGSTFTVRLPAAPAALAVDAAEPSSPRTKGARILAIDDEPQVCEILRLMLEPDGHQVVVCASGEEGLRAFRQEAFDLVLTDLGMPGMSGWEVARAIKALSPATPVALVTGWGLRFAPSRVRASGVDLVLTKPFRMEDVRRLVAEGFLLKSAPQPRKERRNRGSDQSPAGKDKTARPGQPLLPGGGCS